MDQRVIWAIGHGVVLLAVLAGIAFASRFWGILIALGPAAYLLVLYPQEDYNSPKTVVVSHLTALAAGWITYTALAQGITPTSIEPMSEPGLRIVGSALLAFVATTAVFYALNITHPIAYVTTFTAAIGGFPTLQAVAIAAGAVFIVTGLQVIRRKVDPDSDSVSGAHNEEYARS